MRTTRLLFILTIVLTTMLVSWSYSTTLESTNAVELNKTPKIKNVVFGKITINGTVYEKDVVIEKGNVRQRKKGPSKNLRYKYGHTPLTPLEIIPWDCDTLVIGIGMSSRLPVTDEFKKAAKEKGITLILLETPKAAVYLMENYGQRTNAIIHITC